MRVIKQGEMALRLRLKGGVLATWRCAGSHCFASDGAGHGMPLDAASSKVSGVAGRGRHSQLAEDLGMTLDPVKEETKLRKIFPQEEATPVGVGEKKGDKLEKSRSRIRVVQGEASFAGVGSTVPPKKVVTHLGGATKAGTKTKQRRERPPTQRLSKEPTPRATESARPSAESHGQQDPVPRAVPAKSWLDELSPKKAEVQLQREVTAEEAWATELVPKKETKPEMNAEEAWIEELVPRKETNPVQSSWDDELTPVAAHVAVKSVQIDSRQLASQIRPSVIQTKRPVVNNTAQPAPPIHRGYQDDAEVEETISVEHMAASLAIEEAQEHDSLESKTDKVPVQGAGPQQMPLQPSFVEDTTAGTPLVHDFTAVDEVTEEIVLEPPFADSKKVVVQFADEDLAESAQPVHEGEASSHVLEDEVREIDQQQDTASETEGGEVPFESKPVLEEALNDESPTIDPAPAIETEHIPLTTEDKGADLTLDDGSETGPTADFTDTPALTDIPLGDRDASSAEEDASSVPEDQQQTEAALEHTEEQTEAAAESVDELTEKKADFPLFSSTPGSPVPGRVDEGLASVLQSLMREDKAPTANERHASGSLMQSLGWGAVEEESPPPPGVPIPGSPSLSTADTEAPLKSALAERLGWAAPGSPADGVEDPGEDWSYEESQQGRRSGASWRPRDAYGRLKTRTPAEKRQSAMMSGRAMLMALEGRLDEFDPENYVDPELPVFDIPQRRGGVRGRGRGRGQRQQGQREIPNLFRQLPIYEQPEIKAAPHQERDYYHEDALSKLGIKLTQHDLMNLETTLQSLVSSTMNFSTGEPRPWSALKGVSRLAYLESHKGAIRAVMEASGLTFPEARWEQLKYSALRDMSEYVRSDEARQRMLGESPFKNVKNEERFLAQRLTSTVSADHPLYQHMTTALGTLNSNPHWSFAAKKGFVDLATSLTSGSDKTSF